MSRSPGAASVEHVGTAVIGSGFAGLGTAIALERAGRSYVVLERGDDVGGTWRNNTYPGCACDVPSHIYSFSFAPNPSWSRTFSRQPEIQAYLQQTARAYGVLPQVRFGCEVLSASWNGERWLIETTQGPLSADVLVAATGPLSAPSLPSIPGLSSFAGTSFHSAQWNHIWSPVGRRIAVIGTGASAIQFVPEIAPAADRLLLFQRTAPWVLPRQDREVSVRQKSWYARIPALQKARRALLYASREATLIGFRYRPQLLKLAEKQALRMLEEQVPDPVLRAKLTPTFDLGCKRILLSNTYLPALAASNADVITDPIASVVPSGVVTADGTLHEVDTLIFGTGFAVTHPPIASRISAFGVTLEESWKDTGMQALHGMGVAGFPNYFHLVGPNTGLGHNSIVLMIEAQIGHVMRALDELDRTGARSLSPRPDVQASYNLRLQRSLAKTVWNRGGCQSWYLDEHGRNTTLWPTFTFTFRRELARFDSGDYAFSYAR